MKPSIAMMLFLTLILTTGTAMAAPHTVSFSTPTGPQLVQQKLVLEGATQALTASGGPALPMVTETHKYPTGTKIGALVIKNLRVGTYLLKTPLPIIPPKPTVMSLQPGAPVVNSLCGGDFYPNTWCQLEVRQGLDPLTLEPTVFATVRLYPVRVKGLTVHYAQDLEVEFSVANAEAQAKNRGPALMVLAPEAFASELIAFTDHKLEQGVTSITRTLEDIYATVEGRDNAEKIKRAIYESKSSTSAPRAVLLVGDADVFPVRYTFHADYAGMSDWQNIPSDLYYADVFQGTGEFCDWDANGNDVFGEYDNGNVDACDFMPDVLLGRLPVSTTEELTAVLAKIMHYEDTVTGSEPWANQIVLAGADTFGEDSHGDTTGVPEGEYTKELIGSELVESYSLIKLYETERYPRTHELTRDNLFEAIENGARYVNFANHGWVQGWSFEDGFTVDDAHELTNYDRLPVVFSYACSTGVFDTENAECPDQGVPECLAEAFLLDADGGAVGFYGATRTAFAGGHGIGGVSGGFGFLDCAYFKGVVLGHRMQGRLYLESTADLLLTKGLVDTVDFITILQYQYFGDPTLGARGADMQLSWSGIYDVLGGDGDGCAEHGETVELAMELCNDGASAYYVSADLACDSPHVRIVNGHAELPDLDLGDCTMIEPIFTLEIAGDAPQSACVPFEITVLHNYGYTIFQLRLHIGSGPYLTSESLWVTSDPNNDNTAGPGESIQFAAGLRNIGCTLASGVTAKIIIDDDYVTDYGVRGNGIVPDIEPGTTLIANRMFWAAIDPLTPDEHEIMCNVEFTEPETRNIWVFDLPLVVKDYVSPTIDQFQTIPVNPAPESQITVTARVRDGAGVAQVEVTLLTYDSEETLTSAMYDDGAHGDGVAGDNVYGAYLTLPAGETYFRCDVFAADNLGNSGRVQGLGGLATLPFAQDDQILLVSNAVNDLYLGLYAQALDDAGYGYDVWSWYRGTPSNQVLDQYVNGAVVWFYSHTMPILEKDERDAIEYYLEAGGNLLLTEQDVGWAMIESGDEDSEQWYREVLLTEYRNDSSGLSSVQGVAEDPVGDGLEFELEGGSGAHNQLWPSLIDPIVPAVSCMTYENYSGPYTGAAAIRADRNNSKQVYLAFGLEGVATRSDRAQVMTAVMGWFGIPAAPKSCPWDQAPGWWTQGELPTAVMYTSYAACMDSERIYYSGGIPLTFDYGQQIDPKVYAINVRTGAAEETGAVLTTPRMYHATACLEGPNGPGIYFVGGLNNRMSIARTVEVLDPHTNQMSTLEQDPLPEELDGIPGTAVVAENKLYIIGLALLSAPFQSGSTWVFDPAAAEGNRWANLNADLNTARFFSASAVLDGKLYVMGGIYQTDPNYGQVLKNVEVLDLHASPLAWDDAAVPDLPYYLYYGSAIGVPTGLNAKMEDHIIVNAGAPFSLSATNYDVPCYAYHRETNTWRSYWPNQEYRMLTSQMLLVSQPHGPEVWLIGGYLSNVLGQYLSQNCEVLHLGPDSEDHWIGIRANQQLIPSGTTLTLALDFAADPLERALDCYIALEVAGAFYFLTAEPSYPNFTEEALPIFAEAVLPGDFTYSGAILAVPLPDAVPSTPATFYAATLYSGTADLASGLAWYDVTIGND